MLKALRACPSRLRPFPEHLLVFTGVSFLWDTPNRDPSFMRCGQGMFFSFSIPCLFMFFCLTFYMLCAIMFALDFIKSNDTSDVVLGDMETIEGEDAIARTTEGRLVPAGKYVNVPNVKGFTKVSSSKPSTRHSSRCLKGPGQSSAVEHVDLSDEIEFSEDQGIKVEGEKELAIVTGKKGMSSGKKAVVSVAGGSSERSGEELVNVGDNFKSFTVCEDVLNHFSTSTVRSSNSAMQADVLISRMSLGVCILAAMLPERGRSFSQTNA
ncbi:hypothetical protein Hdeb2414_s0013g00410491 [Helianthus debilis subsp. tardiflorus]